MGVLRFQLRHPNGHTEQINVEADRALIGSGAHCDIRLPLDQAAVEHVLIEVSAGGTVFARGLSFEPSPTINNIPFTQAPLPAESVLGVGQIQIYAARMDAVVGADGAATKEKKKSSPILLIAAVIMIAAGGYLFLFDDPAGAQAAAPKEAPALWGAPVAACPQAGPQALALANERRSLAESKRERRPFHVQDGVAAVPLFELAAACYKAGGANDEANNSYVASQNLRKEMNDDYRTQRVRLEHALSVNDYPSAQREVRMLLAFTEGKQGEYVTWLSNLNRKLKLKIGKPA